MNIIKFDLDQLKDKQDGFSYYILGRSYDLEENGVQQDYDMALTYYEKGNDSGYSLCTYSLGISYELGLGNALPIDTEKGDELLKQAYPRIMQLINSQETDEIERLYAKFVTGAYHYFGLGGIEKDYKKAFEIIRDCAEKGHIAAIYDLGANFYYNGNGTERNLRLSEHYLRLAKEAGLKRAIEKYEEYEYGDER
jgi:TPR repeat protein